MKIESVLESMDLVDLVRSVLFVEELDELDTFVSDEITLVAVLGTVVSEDGLELAVEETELRFELVFVLEWLLSEVEDKLVELLLEELGVSIDDLLVEVVFDFVEGVGRSSPLDE